MILAAALCAGLAVAFASRVALARRRAPLLPPPLAVAGVVSVLLPVRNEEANIEGCLAALAAQSIPVRIRVLDDGSTDRTRALADRFAAADPRVEVLAVPAPPEGANGKVHALAFGSATAAAHWLLAIDADARPAPEALARALAAAGAHGLDALSLAARQRTASPGEALLTPLVFGLLDARLGDWRRAARGDGPAVANGQFLLARAAALESAGGYAAILDEPLDDVALARRLAAAGFRVGFWRARDALEVRMYRGFAATFRGWRRNLALLLGDRPGTVAAIVAAALAPLVVAAAGALAADLLAAALAWASGAAASCLLRAGTGSRLVFGLLYPLDALATSACLVAAVVDRARGRLAPWRGRRLDARAREQP